LIVLDASALIDVLIDTEPFADRVRRHLLDHEGDVHAPHLLDAEVGYVLRRHVLARQLHLDRAERAIERLRQLQVTRYPHLLFLSRAMTLHRNLTVYDGLYVALAEALMVPLLTRDGRLARAAGELVEVIHIR
jgi:predicted nucleic acid-binding protein